jgi:hypothetical protein
MRPLHLHLPHRPVAADRPPEALAEAHSALRRGLAIVAAGLLAEALFLAPVVVLVALVLLGRALF